MSVYRDNGYGSRVEYLRELAANLGIPESKVFALAELLGPTEDFDGLVTMLEDMADEDYAGEDSQEYFDRYIAGDR